jgi:hypothetical protein
MTALVPVDQIERMAISVAKSGLFGVKNPDQAMALMLIAQAEGLHPAIAARDYHIIQGRPALKADAMLARFQSAGGKVKWISMTDQRVAGEFSHAQGGSVEIEWTIEMAKRAGLTKNPTWNQYPRAMLRARCISEGIRTVFPGVVVGTYTPEEVQDMDPPQQRQTRQNAPESPAAPLEMAEVVVDVDSLIERIKTTATIEGMELWRDEIRRIPKGPDRERVMAVTKRRVEELRVEQQPEPVEPADEGVI